MGQSSQEVTASLQELVTALLVSTVTKLLLQGRVSSITAEQTQQNVAKPSASATGPNSNLRNTRNRNTGGGVWQEAALVKNITVSAKSLTLLPRK